MKKRFLNICAALFALMILCSVTTRAADNVYAILYDDGTLVFQYGNTPESGKSVKKMYAVDLSASYAWDSDKQIVTTPWYNERKSVRVVNFKDKISPTSTAYWFQDYDKLKHVDNIQNLDITNVTDMSYMFWGCSNLMVLDLSHFNTHNVTDMTAMFPHCSSLTELDLSNLDTVNVKSMAFIFSFCSNLKTIYSSDKFTTASVIWNESMFHNCTSLVGGNGTKYDSNHTDKEYARIDMPSAPGYFTASKPEPQPMPETYIITSYAGEGGTVTPAGDTRVSVGGTQKYVMTPNPGYRVRSVHIDGAEIGAPSEYVFQNVIRDHNLAVYFERLPRYAITAAVADGGQLSVSLENDGAVTVAVWYADQNGQFLSVDMKPVSANAGSVTFALPFAYKARVALFDSGFRPLCDPVTVR